MNPRPCVPRPDVDVVRFCGKSVSWPLPVLPAEPNRSVLATGCSGPLFAGAPAAIHPLVVGGEDRPSSLHFGGVRTARRSSGSASESFLPLCSSLSLLSCPLDQGVKDVILQTTLYTGKFFLSTSPRDSLTKRSICGII